MVDRLSTVRRAPRFRTGRWLSRFCLRRGSCWSPFLGPRAAAMPRDSAAVDSVLPLQDRSIREFERLA